MKKSKLVNTIIVAAAMLFSMPASSNPPATSGPIVIRFDDAFAMFDVDTNAGISSILGADPNEFCIGIIDFDTVSFMDVDVPEDANRISEKLSGHVRASVWPFTVFDCNLFLTVPPLATGMAKVKGTDNDLVVFLNPDNVNANAFGYNAHGKLFDQSGSAKQFSLVFRGVWDGNDPSTLKVLTMIHLGK